MSQKSPKFFLREKVIREIVNKRNLRKTWKKKTHTDFRNFFLVDSLDHLDVHVQIDDICTRIVTKIQSGEYSVSGTKRYLVEKTKGLCRQMTIPSVDDALTLQCLADAFWSEIKSKSPSNNAFFEPKDHSFSKDENDIPEYGSVKAWLDFQKKILGFSEENKYIVITDIANYYDFIDFSHLRNVIVSTVPIREPIIDFLMYILSGMCWKPDYMPTRDVGMPQIDIDAPRLLAHCFLFELDAVVEDMSFANYTRFMDDIDAGANDISQAKHLLKSIDLTLQTRQLRLNSGKTRILTQKEARGHFKVLENFVLDVFKTRYLDKDTNLAALKLPSILVKWQKRKVFDEGNGEKILKRIISYAIKCGAQLDKKFLYETLLLRPNLRSAVFRYLSHNGYNAEDIIAIKEIFESGYICDDSFYIEFSKSICVGKINNSAALMENIEVIIKSLDVRNYYQFYSALVLSYRFRKIDAVMSYVEDNQRMWRHDDSLGRLVGGFSPIARRDRKHQDFSQMIMKSLNRSAISVLDFHFRLRTDKDFVKPVLSKFSRNDSSFPCGVRLGKWLVLHSLLLNNALDLNALKKIKKTFASLKEEELLEIPGL